MTGYLTQGSDWMPVITNLQFESEYGYFKTQIMEYFKEGVAKTEIR